jgi:hypothetical protein
MSGKLHAPVTLSSKKEPVDVQLDTRAGLAAA